MYECDKLLKIRHFDKYGIYFALDSITQKLISQCTITVNQLGYLTLDMCLLGTGCSCTNVHVQHYGNTELQIFRTPFVNITLTTVLLHVVGRLPSSLRLCRVLTLMPDLPLFTSFHDTIDYVQCYCVCVCGGTCCLSHSRYLFLATVLFCYFLYLVHSDVGSYCSATFCTQFGTVEVTQMCIMMLLLLLYGLQLICQM
jgi:hypothetical protein